jgi:hypothetical protein
MFNLKQIIGKVKYMIFNVFILFVCINVLRLTVNTIRIVSDFKEFILLRNNTTYM